ncbi:8-oxoguanine glycosylase ogg1 [Mucor velutinosus]|uniref:RNA-binding protein VTS1 n=1 Tax=Mucor velutinosus TaxID=708070 RepID=A0AAN7DAL3_9FUNG|nr:8-oxoguanine glycosylase ogg1 [Mucor velutinosus]
MSSFQRRFASLLSTDNSSPSTTTTTTAAAAAATSTKIQSPTSASPATANNLTPDMALFNSPNMGSNIRLSPADRQHHQRPVSEVLKPESFISPEAQVLDKWFEDLQQYESSLESMATASLDPKYKEEVQHVDQWFRYLNEAERTATIYTLLQHSTQVQIRFFITVLQQMDRKDPVGALLSPTHPEKVDMQAQLTGAMKKAELEASQKLLSVLPYQTGQVIARPNANAIRRQHIDRHSFALGDTEEYDHLFSRVPGDYSLRNSYASQQQQQQQQQQQHRGMFDHPINTRPKSVIEGNASIFSNDWSYGGFGQHHQQQPQQQQRPNATVGANRPKSADISNWSYGLTSSVSSKSVRDGSKDSLVSPWSGLSPTVNTFREQQQQQQSQQQNEVDQQLSMMANKWNLGGGGGGGGNGSNNRSSIILNDDTNGFKRRATAMSIPETADEQYHVQSPPATPAPVVNNPTTANIVLSLYDESVSTPSTSTQLFGHNEKRDSFYKTGESSPVPSQSTSMNLFSMSTNTRSSTHPVPKQQQQQQHTFGQFLNPNDRINTNESVETGYYSDHSDTSNRSNGSKSYYNNNSNKKKVHYAGNNVAHNGGYYNSNALRNGGGGGGNHTPAATTKESKKNVDAIDMDLLEDIPAWLRSLRLHKYNPIFESMKWQDMLKMDDEALLNKGVAALGARRKLLKVFDQVKAHCAAQNITY